MKNMKKQTLKELIEVEFDRCETISHFKKEVFRLIDLYDSDKRESFLYKDVNRMKEQTKYIEDYIDEIGIFTFNEKYELDLDLDSKYSVAGSMSEDEIDWLYNLIKENKNIEGFNNNINKLLELNREKYDHKENKETLK